MPQTLTRRATMIVSRITQIPTWRRVLIVLVRAPLLSAPAAFAGALGELVFFGDSLSDPGTSFIAFGTVSRAPFEPIPDAPYAIGGHHFSNGATWAEQLAWELHRPTTGAPAPQLPAVFPDYAGGRAPRRARGPAV